MKWDQSSGGSFKPSGRCTTVDNNSKDVTERNSEDDSSTPVVNNQQAEYAVVAIEMPLSPTTAVLAADSTVMRNPTLSLPATNNWPGDYGFDISFPSHEKTTKRFDWTYSSLNDKLYVVKDMPCPINFTTNYNMPEGTTIRATAVYTSPEHASESVQRCVNHCIEDANKGILYPEQLIRCECNQASYEEDPITHRHSVVVPYENPQSGEKYSTYIFKFVCWGSCTGGLNRRPVAIVFTLEHGGQVIGRRSVEVRICACPLRDRRADEKSFQPEPVPNSESKKRKSTDNISNLPDVLNFIHGISYPFPKKMKSIPPSPDGTYTITVADRNLYQFLKAMKLFYELCSTLKNVAPQFQRNLLNSCFMKKGRCVGDSREAK